MTKDDYKELIRILDKNIKTLWDKELDLVTRVNIVTYSLGTLKNNIEKNLEEKVNKELKIHDKVKVIKIEEMDQLKYLKKEGWIVGIDNDYEYPYSIQFDDGSSEWLWKREQLILL